MTDNEPKQANRRSFMKLAGLGAAGASIGLGVREAEASQAATAADQGGYQESEHVKTYYRLARF